MGDTNKRLIIKSGNVFDSIKGVIRENSTIAIVGNKIAWIGDDAAFEKEAEDQVIDASGKTIIPGMIECHVHIAQLETAVPKFLFGFWVILRPPASCVDTASSADMSRPE